MTTTTILAKYLQKVGTGIPQSIKQIERWRQDGLRAKHDLIKMLGNTSIKIPITKSEESLQKDFWEMLKKICPKHDELYQAHLDKSVSINITENQIKVGKNTYKLGKYLRDKYDADIESVTFKAFMTSRVASEWIISADPYDFVQNSSKDWGNCLFPSSSRGNAFSAAGLSPVMLIAKKISSSRNCEDIPELPEIEGRFFIFVDPHLCELLAANFYGISTYTEQDVLHIMSILAQKVAQFAGIPFDDLKVKAGGRQNVQMLNYSSGDIFYFNEPLEIHKLDNYWSVRYSLNLEKYFYIPNTQGRCLCCGRALANASPLGCESCRKHNKGKHFCAECGTLHPAKAVKEINGQMICINCLSKKTGVKYEKCEVCGGYFEKGKHKHRVKINGKFVKFCSDECLREVVKICEVCGKPHTVNPFPYNVDINVCSEKCLRKRTNQLVLQQVTNKKVAKALIDCNNLIAKWYQENLDEDFMKNWTVNAYNYVKLGELDFWQEILMGYEVAVKKYHALLLPKGQDWFWDAQSVILQEYAKLTNQTRRAG